MVDNNKKILNKAVKILVLVLCVVGIIGYFIIKNTTIRDLDIKEESVQLVVGETYTVEYQTVPKSANKVELLWSTDNESAISIDNGVITAKEVGNGIVWVKVKSKPEIKKRFQVTVMTKNQKFKYRLMNIYEFKKINDNYYQENDTTSFDFDNAVYTTSNNGMIFRYYYKDNVVVANPSFRDTNTEMRFYLNEGTESCVSTTYNDFCAEENKNGVRQGKDIILTIFQGYLGREYTIGDL